MLHSPIAKITALVATAVIVWALAKGRWPERVAALTIAVDWFGSTIFQDRRPHHHGQPAMVALDVLQVVVFLGLAVGCRRIWVLWAAAFAALLIFTHGVFTLNPGFGQWAYLTMNYIWSLGLLASVAAGVGLEGRKPAQPPSWLAAKLTAFRLSTPSARVQRRS